MLLGFDGLVQPFRIPAAVHQTAGEFVHDDDFPIFYYIVPVPDHQGLGLQGFHQLMGQIRAVFRIIHVLHTQHLFRFGDPGFRRRHGLEFFIHRVVFFFL